MADEVTTATTEATPVSAEAAQAVTPSSETVTSPTPAATDGATVSTEETFNAKIDPKTLSGDALRIYKKYQADYTRARQADKAKFDALQERIKSVEPLMNDPDVRAKAYYLQYGRYPEGYNPSFLPPQNAQEEKINPEEIADPVVRKIYMENQVLQQEREVRAKAEYDTMVKATNEGVKTFYEKLPQTHKTLWQENLKDITDAAMVFASKGLPVDKALSKAFNASCSDKLVEFAKLEAINSMKVKAQQPKPETSVNVAGGLVQGEFKTPEEAVRAAIQTVRGR